MTRRVILAAYGAIAIFTFGHAATGAHSQVTANMARCEATNVERRCYGDPTSAGLFIGLAAAVLWPLYWSWEVQS